jgi:hypothetical protein
VPLAESSEVSVKMQKVEGIWLIYDVVEWFKLQNGKFITRSHDFMVCDESHDYEQTYS